MLRLDDIVRVVKPDCEEDACVGYQGVITAIEGAGDLSLRVCFDRTLECGIFCWFGPEALEFVRKFPHVKPGDAVLITGGHYGLKGKVAVVEEVKESTCIVYTERDNYSVNKAAIELPKPAGWRPGLLYPEDCMGV
jgi:hypothetical protein